MLVLLPPSEGKSEGGTGPAVALGELSLAGLTTAREAVLRELSALCSADAEKAREVLGLSERQGGEVAKNAVLRSAPARPAGEVYSGVLYDALGLATLTAAARERAERALLVFSGLWGAVRVTDRIPSYRCPIGVRLPGLGPLGGYWRPALTAAMPAALGSGAGGRAGAGLLLDLRSAAYGAMWKPAGELAERTATVRVLHAKTVAGVERRTVVSHFNKATKGRVVRELLTAGVAPPGPAELAEELRGLGYTVEGGSPARPGQPWRLDVVVTEL